jgi:hypothetical protein
MNLLFWEWMIRGDGDSGGDQTSSPEEHRIIVRDGKIKSAYGPHRARDLFNIPTIREDGPIWTFDRMGATRTPLPDGRVICIGGEHEDFYDPDFYIYNDVVVLGPHAEVEIFGYPKESFPPTDFHSATVASNQIIVIGGLGYVNERLPEYTPVYALDLWKYQISKIATSGEMPGWISEHEASFDPANNVITIKGGQVIREQNGKQHFRRNFDDYELDMNTIAWRRLTNRNWREFSIRQEKGAFVLQHRPKLEAILPSNIEQTRVVSGKDERARFVAAGISISVTIRITHIEIIVEGNPSDAVLGGIVEEIRAKAEASIQRHCLLIEVR